MFDSVIQDRLVSLFMTYAKDQKIPSVGYTCKSESEFIIMLVRSQCDGMTPDESAHIPMYELMHMNQYPYVAYQDYIYSIEVGLCKGTQQILPPLKCTIHNILTVLASHLEERYPKEVNGVNTIDLLRGIRNMVAQEEAFEKHREANIRHLNNLIKTIEVVNVCIDDECIIRLV